MYYSETTEILLEYQFSKAKHKTTIPWIMEAQQQFVGEFFYNESYARLFYQGWDCHLTEEQFIAVKELVKKCYAFLYLSF